jgi:hypothetical protein
MRVFVEKIETTQGMILKRNVFQSGLKESILDMQSNEHRRDREIGSDVLNLKVVARFEYPALKSGVQFRENRSQLFQRLFRAWDLWEFHRNFITSKSL